MRAQALEIARRMLQRAIEAGAAARRSRTVCVVAQIIVIVVVPGGLIAVSAFHIQKWRAARRIAPQ